MFHAGVMIVSVLSVVIFVAVFLVSGLSVRVNAVMTTLRGAIAVISDNSLDDREKERRTQAASIFLFRQFAMIVWISLLLIGAPGAVVWVGELTGLAPFDDVYGIFIDPIFIVASIALAMATVWLIKKRKAD